MEKMPASYRHFRISLRSVAASFSIRSLCRRFVTSSSLSFVGEDGLYMALMDLVNFSGLFGRPIEVSDFVARAQEEILFLALLDFCLSQKSLNSLQVHNDNTSRNSRTWNIRSTSFSSNTAYKSIAPILSVALSEMFVCAFPSACSFVAACF